MSRCALWPGQLLARLVLSSLLLRFFLLRWLIGLKLGVEHGEYDPDQPQGPHPSRQPDPQDAIEGVPVGLADHEGGRDRDVEQGQSTIAPQLMLRAVAVMVRA